MNRQYKSLWLHMRKRAAKGKKDQDFLHRRHSNFFVLHCFATICENYLICFTFWSIEVGRGTTKYQFLLCDGWMIMAFLTGLLCLIILWLLFFPLFSHRGNNYDHSLTPLLVFHFLIGVIYKTNSPSDPPAFWTWSLFDSSDQSWETLDEPDTSPHHLLCLLLFFNHGMFLNYPHTWLSMAELTVFGSLPRSVFSLLFLLDFLPVFSLPSLTFLSGALIIAKVLNLQSLCLVLYFCSKYMVVWISWQISLLCK